MTNPHPQSSNPQPQTSNPQPSSPQPSFLAFLPVSLFGGIMGLSGLTISWRFAHQRWGISAGISEALGLLTLLAFIVLTLTYAVKCFRHPAIIRKELEHPVLISFFGTIPITLLLIPGIILPYNAQLACGFWLTGMVAMGIFSWYVFRKWLSSQQDPANILPAWILPIVGTLDVPIIGYRLPISGVREICLVFYGIGIVFALIMMTMIISRLLFQKPLPIDIQPTQMILIGPFALAFSGYESLTGSQDLMASVLFYFAMCLLMLFGSKILRIPFCCPFRVTWWSVSFPLVAITIAAFHYAEHNAAPVFGVLAGALLTLASVVIAFLLIQTLYRIATGTFILPVTQPPAPSQPTPQPTNA